MIRPTHVQTSAFYGFVFESAALGRFGLARNDKRAMGERRARKRGTGWRVPLPAQAGLQRGSLVWLAYDSVHDTRRLFVLPDRPELLEDERHKAEYGLSPFPVLPEPEPTWHVVPLYVWHWRLAVAPISGRSISEPQLFVNVPSLFHLPWRWRERSGRDDLFPPAWHVYINADGILAYARADYVLDRDGERTQTVEPPRCSPF